MVLELHGIKYLPETSGSWEELGVMSVAVVLLCWDLFYMEPKTPANTALLKFTHLSKVLR